MRAELCTLSLGTGAVTVVLETERHIEAPNWSRDGGSLIVNAEGRLYRVPITRPRLIGIDTNGFSQLNNDHGLSPDGTLLAISDKTETGKSCIYVLPSAGGRARRVTDSVPSYFHGWSPDGESLVYCAFRGGTARIVSCPAGGGDETILTDPDGHDDGPDYTPDGRWIWFNSDRSGHAQLWRMRPDGTGMERMTDDERVNWFPHPSPCGKHVVFLSYPEGTMGHPGGLDVELRLMPAEGGQPRPLLGLHGGQGTINVPSWHPGSGAFAFVRYLP